ncbi:hypothetical protein TNCV_1462611 [Trichonephila clavipes]|nr:hypothetical protein TNCV_1462611 [Trichonephila clavipes]
MNKIWKTPAKLDGSSVLSEEYIEVEDDNVCIALIMTDKDILELDLSSKNIINADSENENEMDVADPVPTSFEMGKVLKNMHTNLDAIFQR